MQKLVERTQVWFFVNSAFNSSILRAKHQIIMILSLQFVPKN